MVEFDYPGYADGNFEHVKISSLKSIGYEDGMPYVEVNCSCGRVVKLMEDNIWKCNNCERDLEQFFFQGMRTLKNL